MADECDHEVGVAFRSLPPGAQTQMRTGPNDDFGRFYRAFAKKGLKAERPKGWALPTDKAPNQLFIRGTRE